MRVWIDLSNSPHPLLFAPVARRLAELGHEVVVTARDNAQTVELARERWPSVEVIGGPSPPGRRARRRARSPSRVGALRRWARERRARRRAVAQLVRPDRRGAVARDPGRDGHGLRAPAGEPPRLPARRRGSCCPRRSRVGRRARQGATPRRRRYYPGLKEELYLGDFAPDPAVLAAARRRPRRRPRWSSRAPPPSRAALPPLRATPSSRTRSRVRRRSTPGALRRAAAPSRAARRARARWASSARRCPDVAVDSRSLCGAPIS